MEPITSRQNPIVARFRRVSQSAASVGCLLLEGPRLIDEALAAAVSIEVVAVSTDAATLRRSANLIERLDAAGTQIAWVSPLVMQTLSPVATPSGLVALATLRPAVFEAATTSTHSLVIGLVGVQDPGNTGAVIRAVEAGGATGVVTIGGADPYGWKALRGSMGSAFRLPIIRTIDANEVRAEAVTRGLRVLAATPRDGTPVADADLITPCLVWLGGEGAGLAPAVVDMADEIVSIPMRAPVESLNIAVAAALIVYEASRQRDSAATVAADTTHLDRKRPE